jgi:hypothetical protein
MIALQVLGYSSRTALILIGFLLAVSLLAGCGGAQNSP